MSTTRAQRTRIVAGNWKMNTRPHDAAELARALAETDALATVPSSVRVVVCPPHTSLAAVQAVVEESMIALGGQDCHHERSGAYTGDVSADALVQLGCRYVIVGHSERRRDHGETDARIAQKALRAYASGLVPIVCVGETLDEREAGRTLDVIGTQFGTIADAIGTEILRHVVVAYEPVWAIGTGRSATPEQAQEVHAFLRQCANDRYAASISLLYGGSVTPANAGDLFGCADIDGALVGGASLDAGSFATIVTAAVTAAQG